MQVTFAGIPTPRDAALCARFGIATAGPERESSFELQRHDGRLRLSAPRGEFAIEFDLQHGPLAHRLRTARRSEPLPRAVGLLRRLPTVLDATAGFGTDALVLAKLGCSVTAVERIGALAMLLADAVEGSAFAARLTVRHGDARQLLAGLTQAERPDVVYLDPMFAEHGKAQVKKAAQALRQLAGPPDDVGELFDAARATARERVVVKRPPGGRPLAAPDFAVGGGRVRFDVYLLTGR